MTLLLGLAGFVLEIWGVILFWDTNIVWCICVLVELGLIFLNAWIKAVAEENK